MVQSPSAPLLHTLTNTRAVRRNNLSPELSDRMWTLWNPGLGASASSTVRPCVRTRLDSAELARPRQERRRRRQRALTSEPGSLVGKVAARQQHQQYNPGVEEAREEEVKWGVQQFAKMRKKKKERKKKSSSGEQISRSGGVQLGGSGSRHRGPHSRTGREETRVSRMRW